MTTKEELEEAMIEDGHVPRPTGDRLERLIRMGRELAEAVTKKEELKKSEKLNNELIKKLAENDIPSFMAELGITTQGLPDGRVIEIEDIIAAKMPDKKESPDQYSKAVAWLDEHDIGDIVKREVVAAFGKDSQEQVQRMIEAMRVATNGEIPISERQDVNYQTLNATLKEEKRKGRPLPKGDDGFDIYIGPRAKIRK